MSQKKTDFQSKPRFGGSKFGGKGKGGGKFAGKGARPPRRDFDKGSEGDRPRGGDRADSRFPRDGAGGGKSFDKKPRFEGGGGKRPYDKKKSFGAKPRFDRDGGGGGDRAPYNKGGERAPYKGSKPRFDGERKPRFDGERKPRFDRDGAGGDRAPYKGSKPRFDGERKPRFDGERKPRFDRDGASGKPRFDRDSKPRFDGERKPRFDRDDRAPRKFDDRKGGFNKDKKFGDKKFGDRKPRFDRDSKPGADRDSKPRFDRDAKPRFDREERDAREDREAREARRPKKSWQRYDDRPARPDGDERGPASFETREKLKSARSSYGAPSSAFLYGVHAVTEALLNPKRMHQRLLCTPNGYEAIEAACRKAQENGIKLPEVIYVEKDDISRLLPRDAVHQDILLDAQPLEEVFLVDIINELAEDAKILVLDQVTDPHNVGAIIRSAAAFGASAVVVQKVHAPDVTGTLAKAASGAVEHVPFVREVNLSRALEQLKEAGFTCLGLAEEGKRTLSETGVKGRVALVLGAEGEGLRRLVAENCDELVRLPTGGAIGSLNVSNAAAVALYEMARS